MKDIQIIVSHPRVDSLIVSVAQQIQEGLTNNNKNVINYTHLDQIHYDPILTSQEITRRASFDETTILFQKTLFNIDTLILCYPDWWGLPPAQLTGWIQRVFANGVAFSYMEKEVNNFELEPKLAHLQIIYIITSDEKDAKIVRSGVNTLQDKLSRHAGVKKHTSFILPNTRESSLLQRKQWIKDIATFLQI